MSTPYRIITGQDPRHPDGVTIEQWQQLNVEGAKAAGGPEGWRPVLVYRSAKDAADALYRIAAVHHQAAVEATRRAIEADGLALHVEGLLGAEGDQVSVYRVEPLALL